jgi:hypothetical protein
MASIAIVGAGPAGLAAAEVLSAAGREVHVYDTMPSVGRKFLLAGLGGLNLTHAEAPVVFGTRYADRQAEVAPWLAHFGGDAVRAWAHGLGIDTFVGSSQRVFPVDMKAAPLLRAWLQRLRHPASGAAVAFHMRHRCVHLQPDGGRYQLRFDTTQGPQVAVFDQVVLAMGGGSWSRLGSDGRWQHWLADCGVPVRALRPANCGFDVAGTGVHHTGAGWSDSLRAAHAGAPLKGVVLHAPGFERKGECVLTETGLEGSLVYAASAGLRNAIERDGSVAIALDLMPERSDAEVLAAVAHPRGSRSLGSHLRSRLRLDGAKLALVFEAVPRAQWSAPAALAAAIKRLPITLLQPRPLDEAISSAGGVAFEGLTEGLELRALPGVWCAGEMVDWEAPTGGYLLTACLASGRWAAQDMLRATP